MEPIRVHAPSVGDAQCVADALAILRAEIRLDADEKHVVVTPLGDRDRALVEIIDVLQSCLEENGVDAVHVLVGGATYALRGTPPVHAGGA